MRILIAAIAIWMLTGLPPTLALAQVQPQPTEQITPQGAADLLTAIQALERGDCKGVPPPRAPAPNIPAPPDTRTCEPYKLGAVYGRLAVDLRSLKEVIAAVQDADKALQTEIFGAEGPKPVPPTAAQPERDAWQAKQDRYVKQQNELLKQEHPIRLEHIPYADFKVGDAPLNPIYPDILVGLAPILDGMEQIPHDAPEPTPTKPEAKKP